VLVKLLDDADVVLESGVSHVSSQSLLVVMSAAPFAQSHAAANRLEPSPHAHSVGMNSRQSAGGLAHGSFAPAHTSTQSTVVVQVPSERQVGGDVTAMPLHTHLTSGHSLLAAHASKSGHAKSRFAHAAKSAAASAVAPIAAADRGPLRSGSSADGFMESR
jgi:hypothetical protein